LTGGQDLFLELFDEQGILKASTEYSSQMANRTINLALERGNYVVRVRAGNTTQNKQAGFRLSIQ
jgi:hypothetical protein